MFGLSKLYEAGYSYSALTGLKFLLPAERDELVSSYRDSLKIDFLGLFKAMLLMLAIIVVAATMVAFFALPKSLLDVATYLAMLPIFIVAFRSNWKHLKKRIKYYP